ncbi:TetR family transcriptional regulator [Devosia sp.]|uniref:TetR family transcriptional regulator n=1 Tax=Devosia sp. TaxID=1871048 RepID=UPI003BABBEBF
MSRPRTISDASVTDTVAALLVQTGPGGLTFASAAAATGLSPATLVQRFGSRDALLRAALLSMWDQADRETAAADAAQAISAEGAIDVLTQLSAGYGSGEAAAEGLLLLREDYRDPVLRARGAAWNVALATALGRRLSDDAADQQRLGRLMASQWQGAVLWWGFSRDGRLTDHLGSELREWLSALGL